MQLHWILNLARYISADTQINIRDISEVYTITANRLCTRDGVTTPLRDYKLVAHLAKDQRVQYYLLADKLLHSNLMGQSLTVRQILIQFKKLYPALYNDLFSTAKELTHVLS